MTPPASRTGSGFGVGLAAGLAVAVVMLLAGAVKFVRSQRPFPNSDRARMAVVVLAQDVPEGGVLSMDALSMRLVPEEVATSSVVKPDSANDVINQRVLAPLQRGDLLLWSQVEPKAKNALFLTRDVAAGTSVAEADLEERAVAPALLTASWVTPKDRPRAVGRTLAAPFRAGDPLLWTHFAELGAR